MNNENIYNVVKKISIKCPSRIMISVFEDNIKYTYQEFIQIVDNVANNMIDNGIDKGSHVGILLENCKEWYILFFAIMKIGAIAIPINTAFKEEEIKYIIKQFDINYLAISEKFNENNINDVKKITVDFGEKNAISFDGLMKENNRILNTRTGNMDTCIILPTSGTTGFPKGVMLNHYALIKNGYDIGERLLLNQDDRMLIQVPMFHCFGITLSMISAITHMTSISVISHFNPVKVLKIIENEQITVINGVPTMFEKIMQCDQFKISDISSLQKGIMAGSNCLPDFIEAVEENMKMKIVSVYGLTEASPGCTMSCINEDVYTRRYTVGSHLPDVTCHIIKPETGREVQIGEIGEFIVKGYNVMRGYYNNIDETNMAIDQNGFLHTGDLAKKDEKGNFIITGRLKDMIIRGGENIYPKEVEIMLNKCPGVISSQVVGISDQEYGQEILACIISDNQISEDDIKDYLKGKCANYKIPKYIKFMDEFPTNAAGKVLKYQLSKMI